MSEGANQSIAALRRSHRRLQELAKRFGPEEIRRTSYCPDWSVAQVYSHLGSAAVLNGRLLEAGLTGSEPPPQSAWGETWAVWDAKAPEAQVEDSLAAYGVLLEALENTPPEAAARFHVAAFGQEMDFPTFVWVLLSEHAVHEWDVAVSFDAEAELEEEAASLLIQQLPAVAAWTGKVRAGGGVLKVQVTGLGPAFALVMEPVRLEPWSAQESLGVLRTTAPALVRLVYGRLDPEHTPRVDLEAADLTLDEVRAIFPGL